MRLAKLVLVTLAMVSTLTAGLAPAAVAEGTPEASENPLYHGALPWELPDDAEEMVVHSVTDGDTVRLTYPDNDYYYNTRLIGIQAPEMDGPWTEEQCYGPEAKTFLAELLPVGTTVYAQVDVEDEDQNDRRLRHVFIYEEDTQNAYLVTEILVLGGFAEARSYPPNDLYDDVLAEAQLFAREDDSGLWESCAA
jgi:micrococcal nuclease